MNQKEKGYALISMTNGDVYHIDEGTAQLIMDLLEAHQTGFVNFEDTKSGAKVTINLANFSSIVIGRSRDA